MPAFIKTQSARLRSLVLIFAKFAAVTSFALAHGRVETEDPLPLESAQVIHADELASALKGAQKRIVLYVGPKLIYTQAHIPGAENVGPVGTPEGMEKLRARAASLPKDGAVVIYCGCCPWNHCPNIRPAYAALKKAGFTKVRVLYLENSLETNWKDKGFPVANGE
jgi:rhodanese-related sulfurtransferase